MRINPYAPKFSFETTPLVAVYKNLEGEFKKYGALRRCEFLGEGYTERRYELFENHGWTAAYPTERGYPLKVKVFRLPSPKVLRKLDDVVGFSIEYIGTPVLFGIPFKYRREIERIFLKNGLTLKVWLYIVRDPEGKRVGKVFFDEITGIHYTEAV